MWRRVRMYVVVAMAAATTLLTSYIKDSLVRKGKNYRRPGMTGTLFGAKDREDVMYDFLEHFQPKLDPNWELQYESYTRDRRFRPSTCPFGLLHRKNKSRWFESRYIEDIKMFMDREDLEDERFKKLQSKYLLPFGYKDRNKTAVDEIFSVLPDPPVWGLTRRKCVRCAVVGTGGQLKGLSIPLFIPTLNRDGGRHRLSATYDPRLTESPVDEIFSVLPDPPVWGMPRRKCVRCAVVGTGGQLKGSLRGKEIDSHDYVFRLNHALVGSWYVRDVGNKTSFYIFFPESAHMQHVIHSDPVLVYIPFKDWDVAWMAGWLVRKKVPPPKCWTDGDPECQKYGYPGAPKLVRPERLSLAHPDFLRYVFCNYLNATGQRPTTGVFTAFMAVHLCDQVSLYGFGFDPRYPMHYYDQDIFTEPRQNDTAHNFGNERALWRILDRENIVRWGTTSGHMFRHAPGTTRNRTRVSWFVVDRSNHYTTRRPQ
ncbi:hypothetical protein Bbelb_008560 [Branchiostoma belcheri]|nr:hypothetical protein Bbelb_008560 [Branchiostoma belcheri]